MPVTAFNLGSHVKYFLRCLEMLPAPYASLDTNRLTVAYFCISGLDILGALDRVDAKRVIDWIYSLQARNLLQQLRKEGASAPTALSWPCAGAASGERRGGRGAGAARGLPWRWLHGRHAQHWRRALVERVRRRAPGDDLHGARGARHPEGRPPPRPPSGAARVCARAAGQ